MPADPQSFEGLVAAIAQAHAQLTARAAKAVNVSLTLRNWIIGFYIHAYEQAGADRARYGERLLESLTDRLRAEGMGRVDVRELRRFRHFYVSYPQIRETLSPEFTSGLALPLVELEKRETTSPVSAATGAPTNLLLERLAFSHFAELLQLNDAQQRAFYEIETLRGNWSVRELRRQIASQYYQRSGLSNQPATLAALTQAEVQFRQSGHPATAFIRDPYIFDVPGPEASGGGRPSCGKDKPMNPVLLRLMPAGPMPIIHSSTRKTDHTIGWNNGNP